MDFNSLFNNPMFMTGANILAANQPGVGFGGAVGQGFLNSMNQMQQMQQLKEQSASRQLRNEIFKQQIAEAKRKAEMAERIRASMQNIIGQQGSQEDMGEYAGPPQTLPATGMMAKNPQMAQMLAPFAEAGDMGGFADMMKMMQPETPDLPNSYDEWVLAGRPGTYAGWLNRRDSSKAPRVNVTSSFGKTLGSEAAKSVVADYDKYVPLAQGLNTINEAERLLDSGMITGFGADWILQAGKALQQAGFDDFDDPIANTEAYASMMGKETANIIKEFGAGTGLSDADREYAEKIVAGKITLSEKTLRKLLRLNKKYRTMALKQYNRKAKAVMESDEGKGLPYDLVIDVPDFNETPNTLPGVDQDAINAELKRRGLL